MKPIEEGFSSDVLRRIILPGIVLAAGAHPLLSAHLQPITSLYGVGAAFVIVSEIVFFGLITSSGIQWIYYVYEGFRWEWITFLAGRASRSKVERLNARWKELHDQSTHTPKEEAEYLRIYENLLDFPLLRDSSGHPEFSAERPTRLGNIIATYETYAESRYGFDGLHFWDHILNLAPDTARKFFEDRYAYAEGLVLSSFAGATVAILHGAMLLGYAIGRIDADLIIVTGLPGPAVSWWLTLFGSTVWLAFYRAAFSAHRDAGAALRAIVDARVPAFVAWAQSTAAPLPEDALARIESLSDYLKGLVEPTAQASRRTKSGGRGARGKRRRK